VITAEDAIARSKRITPPIRHTPIPGSIFYAVSLEEARPSSGRMKQASVSSTDWGGV
jgi:hypothetical protein